jgi:hypothetical protein
MIFIITAFRITKNITGRNKKDIRSIWKTVCQYAWRNFGRDR